MFANRVCDTKYQKRVQWSDLPPSPFVGPSAYLLAYRCAAAPMQQHWQSNRVRLR